MGTRINETLFTTALHSGDYGISPPYALPKKYVLRKANEIPEYLDLYTMMATWRELGKTEWEVLLSWVFLSAIEEAEKENQEEADITRLFQHDYFDRGTKTASKEKVMEHIMPWFTTVEETEDTIYLTFNLTPEAA